MDKMLQRPWVSWASVGLLAVLCGFLGFLQNRWISEVSRAEKERLQQQLQTELNHLSREFNSEISNACSGLLPPASQVEALGRERAYAAQYLQWKQSHDRMFSRIALAAPQDGALILSNLDLETGQLSPADWPASWAGMRDRLTARMSGGFGRGAFGPGGFGTMSRPSQDAMLIDLPRFGGPRSDEPGTDRGPGPPRRAEQEWLLIEPNLDYVRGSMLPELLRRHLGGGGKLDYQVAVVAANNPSQVIFQSTSGSSDILRSPDAWVNLFEIDYGMMRFRPGAPQGRRFSGPPPQAQDGGRGRWRLLVRHQAGSLEAVVARARWQNIGISAGILILILATMAALVRFSRRAQQLAELQMNFVAGVSHELRTPLTVIRTAAFNLRGRLGAKPEQVERYGKLIQDESEKLTGLVEQILRFASARAGHVIRAREPVDIETLIEQGLRSSRAALLGPDLVLEKQVEPGLPLVLADELAMKHALQNLLDNALKYGTEGNNWIGVFASAVKDENGPAVEVRVADRGPGIPLEEQEHIFDPFFRGQRAVQDQVHGTGLGLNLVKKIVEAHGGTIRVQSEPMKGTEFVVRLPAAPPELQDEFAHSLG